MKESWFLDIHLIMGGAGYRGSVHACARFRQGDTWLMRGGGRRPSPFPSENKFGCACEPRRVHTRHSNVLGTLRRGCEFANALNVQQSIQQTWINKSLQSFLWSGNWFIWMNYLNLLTVEVPFLQVCCVHHTSFVWSWWKAGLEVNRHNVHWRLFQKGIKKSVKAVN